MRDSVDAVDLTAVGWIMTAVGVVVLALTALSLNRGRRVRTTETVAHSDGTQTVRDNRTDM